MNKKRQQEKKIYIYIVIWVKIWYHLHCPSFEILPIWSTNLPSITLLASLFLEGRVTPLND